MLQVSVHDAYPWRVGCLETGKHRTTESTGPLGAGSMQQPDIQRPESTFSCCFDYLRCVVVAVIDEEHNGARLNGGRESPEQWLHVLGLISRWHQDRQLRPEIARCHRSAP